MSTLISRGFGALQRIITRGFFSSTTQVTQDVFNISAEYKKVSVTPSFKMSNKVNFKTAENVEYKEG